MNLDYLITKGKEKDPGLDEYYLAIAFEKANDFPDSIEKIPVNMLKHTAIKEMKAFFSKHAVWLLKKTRK